MSEEQVRGIIIAHSALAGALVGAVRQIAGVEEDALLPISNEGRGPEQLLQAVRAAIADSPAVIFTDLPSGSCAFTARKVLLQRPATALICGVNLPLLLDFVFHRDQPLAELVDRLVAKGRSAIVGACSEEGVRADRAVPG